MRGISEELVNEEDNEEEVEEEEQQRKGKENLGATV